MNSGSDMEPLRQAERVTGCIPQGQPLPPQNPIWMDDSSPERVTALHRTESQNKNEKSKIKENKGKGKEKGRNLVEEERPGPIRGRRQEEESSRHTRPKPLERVQGMLSHLPFDLHQWLINTNIMMMVIQYLQQSPAARGELNW